MNPANLKRGLLEPALPIFAILDSDIHPYEVMGTGIFVNFRNHHFLLSAAHVFDRAEIEVYENPILIASMAVLCEKKLLKLPDPYFTTLAKDLSRKDDPLDVGFCLLDASMAEILRREYRVLHLDILPHAPEIEQGQELSLYGFPERDNIFSTINKSFSPVLNLVYLSADYRVLKDADSKKFRQRCKDGFFLGLRYDPRNKNMPPIARVPDFQSFSGGPLLTGHNGRPASFVGMLTEARPGKMSHGEQILYGISLAGIVDVLLSFLNNQTTIQ